MKKQIMCLSLAAYCGAAFAQTDYKVTFTTDRTDITTIYLCSEEDGTVLDSASCHNGKTKSPKAQSLRSYWTARPLQ